ncbi:MAG: AAA domain-containing protein [Acidimicrobiia bacterium]|nr:AAA domain-containing protein [Acidimicrobiia bacterium]
MTARPPAPPAEDHEAPVPAVALAQVAKAVGSVVVGRSQALEQLLVALLCAGHALLEDVPGVGKTLLAKSLATTLGCTFDRIQFTPDVLPSDITGSSVFDQRRAAFEFRPGPVFTQVLLADEVNRATPRAQSALLEAMEERQVTVDGETRPLPRPFLVLATQNPVELEGTFPLPEAQLDRFLLRVSVGYPTEEEEHRILQRFEHDDPLARLGAVLGAADVLALQAARSRVHVSDPVRAYLLCAVRATRQDERLALGASPRASLALHKASQARALLAGRAHALPDDVKALAVPVLAHRLLLAPGARLRGDTAAEVVADVLASVPVPR